MIGTLLSNQWTITRLLSDTGGNGQVWKARSIAGSDAAIKMPRDVDNAAVMTKRMARFANEIKALRYVQGRQIPAVMPILDDGHTESGKPWYAMPVALPLQIPESFASRIKLIVQLAGTVANLHQAGLEHMDIKLSNLLMIDDTVILGDFGHCKFTPSERIALTEAGVRRTDTDASDHQAADSAVADDRPWFEYDIYSLGKAAWETLTGQASRPPSELTSPEDDIGPYWPATIMHPKNWSGLQDLIFSATLRDPLRRPTVRQFHDEMQDIYITMQAEQ